MISAPNTHRGPKDGTIRHRDVLASCPHLTARQLDYWIRVGAVCPGDHRASLGSGFDRVYTLAERDAIRDVSIEVARLKVALRHAMSGELYFDRLAAHESLAANEQVPP